MEYLAMLLFMAGICIQYVLLERHLERIEALLDFDIEDME